MEVGTVRREREREREREGERERKRGRGREREREGDTWQTVVCCNDCATDRGLDFVELNIWKCDIWHLIKRGSGGIPPSTLNSI